jgi:hypothetical protein
MMVIWNKVYYSLHGAPENDVSYFGDIKTNVVIQKIELKYAKI